MSKCPKCDSDRAITLSGTVLPYCRSCYNAYYKVKRHKLARIVKLVVKELKRDGTT